MIKACAQRTINQWVPVSPCFAGQTVRCERSFSLGLVDSVLQALGVVGLAQPQNSIRFIELLPARHDPAMRRMLTAQHIEAAFEISPFAVQPGDIGTRWKKIAKPIRVHRCVGDDIGVNDNENIRVKPRGRVRHSRDLVGEAHAVLQGIVSAAAESVCVRMVSVPRFELGEPARQSPHDWAAVIGLKIFGIKIKRNIDRPKLIEGLHHAAGILFPPW